MNVYILLRATFHSLLLVGNLLALTAAAWSISISTASPGAVLVILGSIAYFCLSCLTWAETCVPRTIFARVRTEVTLVPILVVFQLIGAVVATSNAIQSVCHDPTSCVALLILSWVAPFCLIVYYLTILIVTFDHAKTDSTVWDASVLEHPWFLRPPPPPPKETFPPLRRLSITPPLSLRTQPSVIDHRRQRSSWLPASERAPSPKEHTSAFPYPVLSPRRSSHYLFMPKWAKDLRPLQRGLELPFPVQTQTAVQPRRVEDPIDAPVSPTAYTEDF
ncbi:hypothetical protein K439DRAFT_1641102 [Ramaria rubella]|nr:hypothetical protein K439DRAFT_1641102 [Ramaria rubella]